MARKNLRMEKASYRLIDCEETRNYGIQGKIGIFHRYISGRTNKCYFEVDGDIYKLSHHSLELVPAATNKVPPGFHHIATHRIMQKISINKQFDLHPFPERWWESIWNTAKLNNPNEQHIILHAENHLLILKKDTCWEFKIPKGLDRAQSIVASQWEIVEMNKKFIHDYKISLFMYLTWIAELELPLCNCGSRIQKANLISFKCSCGEVFVTRRDSGIYV